MNSNISDNLMDWLFDSGSFMQRLKRHNVNDARVRVLKEGWSLPVDDERMILGAPFRKFVWVREVAIYSGQTIWMFARTVIPQETLTGKEKQLRHLKTRSLGSVLFRNSDLLRSDFEVFCVEPKTDWEKKIAHYLPIPEDILWTRRSEFNMRGKTLLLTEVFFPGIALL